MQNKNGYTLETDLHLIILTVLKKKSQHSASIHFDNLYSFFTMLFVYKGSRDIIIILGKLATILSAIWMPTTSGTTAQGLGGRQNREMTGGRGKEGGSSLGRGQVQ